MSKVSVIRFPFWPVLPDRFLSNLTLLLSVCIRSLAASANTPNEPSSTSLKGALAPKKRCTPFAQPMHSVFRASSEHYTRIT